MAQTTTAIGRLQLADPDRRYDVSDGGVNLHAQLRGNFTALADHLTWRFKEGTLANAASFVIVHNFGLNLAKMRYIVFDSGVQLTAAQAAAAFTVAETGGSSTSSITVTNISGGSKTYKFYLFSGKYGVAGDDLDVAINITTTGTVEAATLKTTGTGLEINSDSTGVGTDYKTTLVRGAGTADNTVTLPTATTTLAGLSVAQTFTALQTLSSGLTVSGGSAANSSVWTAANVLRVRGGTSGFAIDNTSATPILTASDAGVFVTGPSPGLGTSGPTYHTVYGALNIASSSGASRGTVSNSDGVEVSANVYRDGANTSKAVATTTGYTKVSIIKRTNSGDNVYVLETNYQDAQTADSTLVVTNNRAVHSITAQGSHTLGSSSGLGTSGNAYHFIYGSVVGGANSSAAMAYASADRINLNANLYRDSASTVKAVSTQTGYTSFEITRTTSSTGIVLAISANYQDAQTANSAAVVTNDRTIVTANALGAWTFGPAAGLGNTSGYHLSYGALVGRNGTNARGSFSSVDVAQFGTNLYRSGNATVRAVSGNPGAAYIEITRGTSGTAFDFLTSTAAQTADSAVASATSKGFVTYDGAWTFGAASNTSLHIFQGRINVQGNSASAGGGIASNNSKILINGDSASTASASTLHFGDNASGTSRQWALVNGRDQANQVAGLFSFIVANAANTDPFNGSGITAGFITSAGGWNFGPTSGVINHSINGGANAAAAQADYIMTVTNRSASGTSAGIFLFRDAAADVTGSITINATANTTAFNTSSDERLKKSPEDFSGIDLVKAMSAKKYERVGDPGVKEIGLYAQELHRVFPQAVTQGSVVGPKSKDFMPWSIDYGKLTPVLVKAIQEQQALIEELQARIKIAS